MSNSEKIQEVINMMAGLPPISPTAPNVCALFGIYTILAEVRDNLKAQEAEKAAAEEPAAEAKEAAEDVGEAEAE